MALFVNLHAALGEDSNVDPVDTLDVVEIISQDDVAADDFRPDVPLVPALPEPPASEDDVLPNLRLLATIVDANPLDSSLRRLAAWSVAVQLGLDDFDIAGLVESAVEEAIEPLYQLRNERRQAEDFVKAEALYQRLLDEQDKAHEAEQAGARHLAAAREALRAGRDPKPHDKAYKTSAGDLEVAQNHCVALVDLHRTAQTEANAGLVAALDALRKELLEAARAEDARITAALVEALRPLLVPRFRIKAVLQRLTQNDRLLRLGGVDGLAAEIAATGKASRAAGGAIPVRPAREDLPSRPSPCVPPEQAPRPIV